MWYVHVDIMCILFICYFILAALGLCGCLWAFSACGKQGLLSSCAAQASHCSGFSCCRAWVLGMQASVVAARGLSTCGTQAPELRLSNRGFGALLPLGMWNLPKPGVEPMSPALAGGFLTSGPQGSPICISNSDKNILILMVQRLALGIFTAMPWVQPQVRELRFCKMQGIIKKKKKNTL